MVSFVCDACQDTIKKPKLEAHAARCHASFTCIDCNVTFQGREWQGHTSCISEEQKYQKGSVNGKGKGRAGKNGAPQSQQSTPAKTAPPAPKVEVGQEVVPEAPTTQHVAAKEDSEVSSKKERKGKRTAEDEAAPVDEPVKKVKKDKDSKDKKEKKEKKQKDKDGKKDKKEKQDKEEKKDEKEKKEKKAKKSKDPEVSPNGTSEEAPKKTKKAKAPKDNNEPAPEEPSEKKKKRKASEMEDKSKPKKKRTAKQTGHEKVVANSGSDSG